ncbi:MAG: HNH endonuclease [Gemmatimonadota bacterium]|nr:HNH endonuclease [Gemmatimonadota bacterium]
MHAAIARHRHRRILSRVPRRLWHVVRREAHPDHRRALKRATLRDCSRRCVYCGGRLDVTIATLDHVYPLAKGGTSVPGNLVAACAPCNRRKGDMLPHEFFHRYPSAGLNFLAYARVVHRALKRGARRAVSLAMAA